MEFKEKRAYPLKKLYDHIDECRYLLSKGAERGDMNLILEYKEGVELRITYCPFCGMYLRNK